MGLFDAFKKKGAAQSAASAAPIPGAEAASEYPREVITSVAATWTMGMTHFAGSPFQQGLAQMFCGAVRERLLDEVEGVTRPAPELLRELLAETQPPAGAAQAFAKLAPSDFDDSYKRLRVEYAKHGVDVEQVAQALLRVVDIMRYVARTGGKS